MYRLYSERDKHQTFVLALTNFVMPNIRKDIRFNNLRIFLVYLTLFLPFVVKAQFQDLHLLQNGINKINSKVFKEKVYLHTDREAYLAGEILWFKAYVTTADFKLVDLSKVLYAELISAGKNPVLQAKVPLKTGIGKGSFYLPAALPSGNYQLRAYTNLMKNFTDHFFQKQICVVNTQEGKAEIVSLKKTDYNIRLIPEGGNLVNGIENKVVFKVTGADQKGILFRGAVVNDRNDTIVRFKPLKFGIGTFSIMPSVKEKYHVVVICENGKSITAEFPKVFEQGYVMRAEPDPEDRIRISVKANFHNATKVFLVGHTQNGIKFADQQTLANGTAIFVVDRKRLQAGVTCFTLFDEWGKPVGERLSFKFPENNIEVKTALDSSVYSKRQKVALEIIAGNKDLRPMATDLSMSVFHLPSNLGLQTLDISSYALLVSELKGTVERPESYFKESGELKELLIDNLMLSYGWNGLIRENLLNKGDQADAITYIPEHEGHLVSVLVKDANTNAPVPNVLVFLSVPGKRVQLFTARSDQDGIARFNTKDLYGSNEMVLQVFPDYKDKYRLELQAPYSTAFSVGDIPPISVFADSVGKNIWRASLNTQLANIFSKSNLNRSVLPPIDSYGFFGKPDKTYMLDDYTRFTTIEEVLREYIPEIWLQRKSGDLKLTIADKPGRALFKSEPLMLLDGVPVFQSKRILNYDPLKLKSIEIIASRYFWGSSSFDGIVNFKTYEGDLNGFELQSEDVVVDYEGMLEERKFYMPEYITAAQVSDPTPDFRNVLYWSPNIKTDSITGRTSIEFYTSDQKGIYIGNLQGVAEDGSLVNHFFNFSVK